MKKVMNRRTGLLWLFALGSILLLSKCSFFDTSHGPRHSTGLASATVSSLDEREITTKDGISMYIPVDAVPPTEDGEEGTLDFTIDKVELDEPYVLDSGEVMVGDVYKFGPSGIVFAEPIQITMPINEDIDGNEFYFYRIDSVTGAIEQYPAIIDTVNNTASTYTYEFSQWMIALMKYEYQRRAAYGPGRVRFTNRMSRPVSVSLLFAELNRPAERPNFRAENSHLYLPAAGSSRKNYVDWIIPQGFYEVCMQWKDGPYTSSDTKTYYANAGITLDRSVTSGGTVSIVIDNNGTLGECSSKPKWSPLKPNNNNNNNNGETPVTGTLKDPRDGKVYKTVKIGDQIWMAENLKYFDYYYVNGIDDYSYEEPRMYIYGFSEAEVVEELTTDANYTTYGVLYNWPMANKVCPNGWHLPSAEDWVVLTDNVGGKAGAGDPLKEAGTSHWNAPNTGAKNTSGFTALPGGYAYTSQNKFADIGRSGSWWTSTEASASEAYERDLSYNQTDMGEHARFKHRGYSVRCLKDDVNGETFVDDRDGTEYKIVTIGNDVWMAQNLAYIPFDENINYPTDQLDEGTELKNKTPRYYIYDYFYPHRDYALNEENYKTYGVLYNWYAAANACPAGWHLPSDDEWIALADECGGKGQSGKALKVAGNQYWKPYSTPADNSSGFSALPGGIVDRPHDRYIELGEVGSWWTSTESGDSYPGYGQTYAVERDLSYNQTDLGQHARQKDQGMSVRCVRNK